MASWWWRSKASLHPYVGHFSHASSFILEPWSSKGFALDSFELRLLYARGFTLAFLGGFDHVDDLKLKPRCLVALHMVPFIASQLWRSKAWLLASLGQDHTYCELPTMGCLLSLTVASKFTHTCVCARVRVKSDLVWGHFQVIKPGRGGKIHKRKYFIQSFDICLKTVMEHYEGIKLHIRFASFFLVPTH